MDDVKKIEPYSDEYDKLAVELALSFCPTIYPCKKCGGPVLSGYCCGNCHTSDPQSS